MIFLGASKPIDFVLTWVDDSDPEWLEKKEKYTGKSEIVGNEKARYRDWDTLKYWFRGVEKFAPWVRYIFFVTDNQKPDWLDINHPKIKWVKHTDFIPSEYLPTFCCQPIEWNLHRIEELSENFVFFNDDVFLIDKTNPTDFFFKDKPCDLPRLGPLYPKDFFSYILFNNISLLNRHFSLKKSIRENPLKWIKAQSFGGLFKLLFYGRRDEIPNSVSYHIHTSFNKKTFEYLWQNEYEEINKTCLNKIRVKDSITSYCVRDWQLFTGEFYPHKPIGKAFQTADMDYNDEIMSYLMGQKGKVICLNDTELEENFDLHKQKLIDAFEKIFPEKSTFEL